MTLKSSFGAGFTLVETLVAIAIVTLAISGSLFAANSALVAAEIARDQLTASYLTQEGIEYVRLMRDDEYLASYHAGGANVSLTAWNSFLTNSGSDSASISACRASTCTLDPTRPMGTSGNDHSLNPCSGVNCQPLYLNNGVYTTSNSSGVITPFTRTIQVIDISGTSDIAGAPYPDKRLVSTVSWSYHNVSHSVSITDHLTPWQ